ncbi:MAG: redoxin domain-containing protein [Bacteroidales bacterium]|nr:redoxin domain-containing protein [Bacteroidales bacterium]
MIQERTKSRMVEMALVVMASMVLNIEGAKAAESGSSVGAPSKESKTDIEVRVANYRNEPVVMGYYFDQKMLVKDTVLTDANGVAHFRHEEPYKEGLYILHFPKNGQLIDMMMPADQTFTVSCDTAKGAVERMKIKGSKEAETFLAYQQKMTNFTKENGKLRDEYKAAGGDQAKKNEVMEKSDRLTEEVKAFTEKTIAENKDNFISTFLTALKDIEIPDFAYPETYTKAEIDSAKRVKSYYYYREHFYDNFNLTDDRLLRTPFFTGKVDRYFKETVPQMPDTVAAEAIRLIEKCRPNKEMFQFFVSTLYNMTNKSNIMGMDAALVALADKYYLSGEADWADEKFLKELREQVEDIRYTLVGLTAHDLKMPSADGQWYRLHEVRAPYTILVFWEPSCGHCKKEIPKMNEVLWKKYQKYGVKIFAVYCQVDEKPWKEFIEEHNLDEWMNVWDPYGRTGYRKYYNIKSTPTIYVLDEHKKIIAKKLGVDQIDDYLAHMFGLPEPERQETQTSAK